MFCGHSPLAVLPKTIRSGPCPDTPAIKQNPRYGRGGRRLLGELQAAGVMVEPVGGGVRVKGFNAESFQTVRTKTGWIPARWAGAISAIKPGSRYHTRVSDSAPARR